MHCKLQIPWALALVVCFTMLSPIREAASEEKAAAEVAFPEKSATPGWLGVALRKSTEAEQAIVGASHALVVVRHVFPDTAAETAGFQKGDVVIAIGSVEIRHGVREMIAHVQSRSAGSEVAFKVHRKGAMIALQARLKTPPKKRDLSASAWVGKPLPDFLLTDVNTGQVLKRNPKNSEVLVLDFWATWCGPCRKSMPVLEQLHRTYAEKGLRMIGVSDEEIPVLETFLRNRPLGYATGHDAEGTLASELFISSYPTFVVVGRDGRVAQVLRGVVGAGKLRSVVGELLANAPTSDQ